MARKSNDTEPEQTDTTTAEVEEIINADVTTLRPAQRAVLELLSWLEGIATEDTDSMGGFFAIRRECLLRFANQAAGFKIVFETIVRGRGSLRVCEVPIVFRDRQRGASKMSLAQATRFAVAWSRAIGRRVTERKSAAPPLPAEEAHGR